MDLAYQRRRLGDVAAGVRLARTLAERDAWPAERLRAHQQEGLEAVVRHAAAHSPFYRERLGRLPGRIAPGDLPTLDKATLLEHYDDIVTVPDLRRDALLAHVEQLRGDALLHGRYRAMTTSGSSGRKGLFVYDRPEWAVLVAQMLRFNAWMGIAPRLPRRRKIAAVIGTAETHMSRRVAATVGIGLHRILALPVDLPVGELVRRLNAFGPEVLSGYPSMLALLAEEQAAGRLRVAPEVVFTSSEMLTTATRARLETAFGVRPYDFYATTEGLWGAECAERRGLHLFEDTTLVENVDAGGRPVPPGEPGVKLLVTSLVNRAQPIIRLEVADAVILDPDPCPCGRSLVRMRSIHGRSDDMLRLGGVAVHPLQFAGVARDPEVVEFQVVQQAARLRVRVVPRGPAPDLERRLGALVAKRLEAAGVTAPQVSVERRERLERQPGGKLQMVVADRRQSGR